MEVACAGFDPKVLGDKLGILLQVLVRRLPLSHSARLTNGLRWTLEETNNGEQSAGTLENDECLMA